LSNAPDVDASAAATLWQIRVTAPAFAVAALETAFESYAFSVSSFEVPVSERTPSAERWWSIAALSHEEPPLSEIAMRLTEASGRCGIAVPDLIVEPLHERDWLAENRRHFPPQRLGRFFVVDPAERIAPPAGAWTIRLAAGPAFGSGTHATTQGCLAAIARLAAARGRVGFRRVLDVGTGSGILAIAAGRAGAGRILATDLDPRAVRTAAENVRRNGVARRTALMRAVGPAPPVAAHGPYDLILANILAAPLRQMMPRFARLLAPRGRLVLSGLLFDQEAGVRAAARAQGLALERRIRKGEWPTLIVRKA
jgi:ribosomal protein L11 methyltransferase